MRGHHFEPEILRPDEPQEALHDFVEPVHLRGDHGDVIGRRRIVAVRREMLFEQLEMDHGRIQRVFQLVRDAGGQTRHGGELFQCFLRVDGLRRRERAIGGQPRADGVEELAQLGELIVSRQIHHHPKLSAAESRDAAADYMYGSEQDLRQ